MKEGLAERADVPAFMKMVITEAKKVGLIVVSLKPGLTTDKEYYSETKFSLNFRGAFVQLASFIDRLTNVAEIVKLDDFSMRPFGSSHERFVTLDAYVELKTFKYLGSSADTLGKSDAPVGDSSKPNGPAGAKAPGGKEAGP